MPWHWSLTITSDVLWSVTCLDEAGKELGQVHLTASKGDVVSFEGFVVAPADIVVERLKPQTKP